MTSDHVSSIPMAKRAAIVLCGGKSVRMGTSKAELPWKGGAMIDAVVAACLQQTACCFLVGQLEERNFERLTEKHLDRVRLTPDQNRGLGPLEGIRTGLQSLPSLFEAAFVSSCDVPMLESNIIRHLFEGLNNYRAVVPVDENRVYGLTAVYRRDFWQEIQRQLDDDDRRVSHLVRHPGVCKIDVMDLAKWDPEFNSLINVNHFQDYQALVKEFGAG